ncbi:tetratricopeptide repeat protein [bacterium]|nr:tetratricopeptide repeat protein [bacterium]
MTAPAPTTTSDHSPRPARRTRWDVIAIAVLALLPYLNAIGGDFVFDDVGVIRDNPVVQREPAWRVFTTVYEPGALYRPLTMLSYVANARIDGGANAFHAVNVALHVLVAVAVYALAARLLGTRGAAWVAAALFAVHPIHTEAVTGIVGRAELLAALCSLLALLALARALAGGVASRRWLALSVAAFAAGLLCKESVFTTIALVLVVHWRLAPADGWRRRLAVVLPYALVGAAYLGLRLAVVGALGLPAPPGALDNPLAHVDGATRLRTALAILWDYLAMLIAPVHLSADYSFSQVPLVASWADPRVWVPVAILGGGAAAALASRTRRPELLVALALFAIPLSLTANILFPIGTIKAERLLYLPSAGACLAAGWLLLLPWRTRPRTAAVLIAAVLGLFAARTWVRNQDWRDEGTLYAATVRIAPDSAKAHHNFAVARQRAGAYDEALAHYRQALRIYPDYADAAFGIGHIATLRGDDDAALRWYTATLSLDPDFTKAHLQLGLLYQRHRDFAAAESAFTAGLAKDPDNPLLLVNLAAARLSQGNRWGAIEALARLDRARPPVDQQTVALIATARREVEVAVR